MRRSNKRASGLTALALALAVLALGPTGSRAAEAGPCGDSYTVRTGDTMGAIATRCASSVEALMRENPQVSDPARISIGQELAVPPAADAAEPAEDAADAVAAEWARRRDAAAVPLLAAGRYTVEPGDDMASIATKLGVPLRDLLASNEEIDPFALQPGQVLALPDPEDLEAIEAPSDTAAGGSDAAGDEATPADAGAENGAPGRYTVQPGDSLAGIAAKAGVPLDALIAANEGVRPRALRPGRSLVLPVVAQQREAPGPAASEGQPGEESDAGAGGAAGETASGTVENGSGAPGQYTVEAGDSLARIAAKTGVPLDALIAANKRVKPRALRPGQSLVLPATVRDEDGKQSESAAGQGAEGKAEAGDEAVDRADGQTNAGIEEAAVTAGDDRAGAGGDGGDGATGAGSGDEAGAGTAGTDEEPRRYTVEPGDSMGGIAARTGVRLAELMAVNEGVEPRALRPGQELVLPGGARNADAPGGAEGGTELAAVPAADGRPEPGGEAAAPAEVAPEPEPMRLEGRIRKGVECPVLKTPDGRTYSLVSQAYGFTPGDYVAIEAEPVEVSFCMQGQTVRVTSMKPRPAPQGG